ncbi:hypothetical protein DFH07DRAFT_769405 [Mycena maculata]|uniref:Uncharacterized protein n=1 Tax=Mycena maculata TaxID=230809 RepID=A0AAD7JPK8_9AGAR|nr:hypothetical protein DFH07DRAFT_769405 [Mycena maculata]
MPRGRPRLDPEIKEQSLQESRKHYEESKFKPLRNREKRREEAKLRMQRKRAAIAASDWRTKREYHDNAAANSARYRDRKFVQEREERSVANAVKMRASPITPTPAPRCKGRLAVEDLNNSAAEEEPDEGRAHHLIEAPMWPMRVPQPKRCLYCFEEHCIGCACMCEASPDWIEHGGHFFPTCKYCKAEDCSGCAQDGASWAILRSILQGMARLCDLQMLLRYPHASTWEAPSWSKLNRKWVHECTQYHDHEGEYTPSGPFVPLTPGSSPPSSPSTLSASTLSHAPSPPCSRPASPAKALSLRERQIQRNAEHYKFLAAEDARIAAVDQKLSKEELTYLASSRPPPVPISPERMRQQFTRILGGHGAPPSILRSKSPESSMLSPKEARIAQTTFYQDAAHQRPCQVPRPEVPINNSHGEGVESHWGNAPVMYAVSGKNRVFQDRGRTMAAFKGTPGADLVFTRNEDELFGFLAENVEGKMTI